MDYYKEYDQTHKIALNAKKRERRKQEKYRIADYRYKNTHRDLINRNDRNSYAKRKASWVYILRNVEGEVIYVGRGYFIRRMVHHKKYSLWWPEVTNVLKRRCKSYADSLVLEAMFIRRYQPKYNTIGVIK